MADGAHFPQSGFDFRELVADSFAGVGGASKGILAALGRHPDIAVNHNALALSVHAVNHPDTVHLPEDVWKVKPREVLGHRQVGLLWASPDCRHFSKAKGSKPVSKRVRGLAWVVCKWARSVKPRVILMENVEEFRTWGPLMKRGADWYPDPARKGETFNRFLGQLERLGYVIEHRELRACDYGAPTIRKRLFLVARRDGLPIVWPEPTHGAPTSEAVQAGRLLPWKTAADCIDWSIPCPSIFDRKKPLVRATENRIAKGVFRYVLGKKEPFIVPVLHGKNDARSHPASEPFRTVTGASRGDRAVVEPKLAPLIVSAAHGEVSPSGVKRWGSGVREVEQPLPTALAGGISSAIATATLMPFGQNAAGQSPGDPLGTVMAGAARHSVIETTLAPFLTEHANASTQRVFAADDPLRTQAAQVKGGHFAVVAPTLVQVGYGEREGQAPRALNLLRPLGVVVGSGKHAVVSAFLAQHNTMRGEKENPDLAHPGRPVTKPLSTAATTGSQQQIVTANLVHFRQHCDGRDAQEPVRTLSAGGEHHGVVQCTLSKEDEAGALRVAAFLIRYHRDGGQWAELSEPATSLTTKERLALVTVVIRGEPWVIVDIGMRMLTPRELARAQGFPDDYCIDRDSEGRPVTKTAQVRMIGNSVCPPVAEALVRANFRHENVVPFKPRARRAPPRRQTTTTRKAA